MDNASFRKREKTLRDLVKLIVDKNLDLRIENLQIKLWTGDQIVLKDGEFKESVFDRQKNVI